MNLSKIEEFLARDNQRFTCTDGASGQFVSHIEHRVEPSLKSDELKSLREHYGNLTELVELYSEFGGLRLYCDGNSSSSAFYLARPSAWSQLKQEFLGWIYMLDNAAKKALPGWIDSCIVFGEIPETSNYLLMPTTGNDSGKVFLFEHDGYAFVEQAADFGAYIDKITQPDAELCKQIRTHTCYSDGETDTQWLVEDYAYG